MQITITLSIALGTAWAVRKNPRNSQGTKMQIFYIGLAILLLNIAVPSSVVWGIIAEVVYGVSPSIVWPAVIGMMFVGSFIGFVETREGRE